MDRWRFYTVYGHWLWAIFFVASIVAIIATCLASCGPRPGPAQQAIKVTRMVVETLCSDEMTVKDCLAELDRGAKYLDGDGGR